MKALTQALDKFNIELERLTNIAFAFGEALNDIGWDEDDYEEEMML